MHFSNFLKKFFDNFRKFSGPLGAPPPDPPRPTPKKCSPRTKILATPMPLTPLSIYNFCSEDFINFSKC